MRILIAVLAIVGSATVTHAQPPRSLPTLKGFLEVMCDPRLFDLPPAENRSIKAFEANADHVIENAIMYFEDNLYNFLMNNDFDEYASAQERATVGEIFNDVTQKLNDAYNFFYELYDQINSTAVYNSVFNTLDKNYFNQRREALLKRANAMVSGILEGDPKHHIRGNFWELSGFRRLFNDLKDLKRHIRDLLKLKYINLFACYEKHLRVLYQYFSWNANGRLLSQQELDQKLTELDATEKLVIF